MKIRRVVTGQNADGKSVFASDEEVEPVTLGLMPGAEFHRMWGDEQPSNLPADGSPTPQHRYFPAPGGFRFGFFTLPPATETSLEGLDIESALREFEEKLPGMAEHLEPDDPGMHTTDTIDYGVVVSGEIWLELDDGAETLLKTGDTYIQNGTRHRWHNRGTEPATLAIAIVGAERS